MYSIDIVLSELLIGTPFLNSYATSAHHIRHTAGIGWIVVALVVKAAFWASSRGYHHRAGEFQTLLSTDHRPAGVVASIVSAVVVVQKVKLVGRECESI